MATISIKRALAVATATFNGDIDTGYIVENANKYYLPLTINNFAAPDLALVAINGVTGQSKLSAVAPTDGSAGAFDNVRVGDVISSTSVGTITAKATVTRNCFTATGLFYVVYPNTYDSTSLGVSAGDAISGAGIPTNTVVDKIDYVSRRIFLSAACSASALVDLVIQPSIRVTAVRKSTDTLNPNQIDFDSVVGTTISNSNVTIKVGAREAVHTVVKLEPINNSTGSRANFALSVAYLDGTGVIGSASGLNNVNILTLGYVGLATFGFDLDKFLINARLPNPA